jgi:hypothetical protein
LGEGRMRGEQGAGSREQGAGAENIILYFYSIIYTTMCNELFLFE